MIYHNLAQIFDGEGRDAERFDRWLDDASTADPRERDALLERWSSAPSARIAHPREDHLAPLFVVAGAAGDDRGTRAYHDAFHGKPISGFRFG